jgi:Holliday junction resolvase RusA-like endonuclease
MLRETVLQQKVVEKAQQGKAPMSISLEIEGTVPSKKNGRRFVVAGGRVRSMPSLNYEAWHTAALWQLKKVKPYSGEYPVTVSISLYFATKHRKDLDNVASSILDTLVDAGIIVDDDVTHVDMLETMFIAYDKANPRALVWIGK